MIKDEEDPCTISDKYLAGLCKRIGSEWPLLGINLMFCQAQVDQVQEAYPRNMSNCVMKMLTSWRDIIVTCEGINPWMVLKEACEHVDRFDLAQEIQMQIYSSKCCSHDEGNFEMLEERIGGINFSCLEMSNICRIFGQTKQCLDRWSKDRHLLVETSAWKAAWQMICKKRIVVICGNPGDGKTTLAYHILSKLATQGFRPAAVSSPEIIEQCYNVKDRVVFFVDDAFGNPGVNIKLVESWIRTSTKVSSFIEMENFRLILATRKHVYLSCQLELDDCECFEDSIIDMAKKENQLTDAEKTAMLMKYCENKHISVTENLINQSCCSSVSGFPLLCKLYTASSELQKIDDFFQQPLAVLSHQLQMVAKMDPKAFCGLIMILIHDGSLSTTVFDVFEQTDQSKAKLAVIKEACKIDSSVPLTSIEDAFKSLIGVYVTQQDECYLFMHDAIFDAVTFVFGKKFPSKLLKICSAKFLLRRVRCYKGVTKQQPDDCTDMIFLPRRLTIDLSARFLSDIQKGYLSEVFDNPSFYDKQVKKHFIDEVKKLEDHVRQQILRRRDNKISQRFMAFVCSHGMVDLVRCLLEEGMQLTEDTWLCACKYNQIGIVDLFIEYGMDVNRTEHFNLSALHVAADEGHLDLLKHLLSKGANATLKTIGGVQPISIACRRWHVKCVNFLVNHGVDPNTSDRYGQRPVHAAAGKGDLEWFDFLVKKGADPFVKSELQQQPIHNSAECDNSNVLKYLLGIGADPNAITLDCKTALHFACKKGQIENIKLLLSYGADVMSKDSMTRLPMHEVCMSEKDCAEIFILIEENLKVRCRNVNSNNETILPEQLTEEHETLSNNETTLREQLTEEHETLSNNETILREQLTEAHETLSNNETTLREQLTEENETLSNNETILPEQLTEEHETLSNNETILREQLTEEHETLSNNETILPEQLTGERETVHSCTTSDKTFNSWGDNNKRNTKETNIENKENIQDETSTSFDEFPCKKGLIEGLENVSIISHKNEPVEVVNEHKDGDNDVNGEVKPESKLELQTCVNEKDSSGMTALHYACKHIHDRGIGRVKELLRLGADIHAVDDTKMQPLLYACDNGSIKTAELLIQHGANINWRGFNKQRAVHFAAAGNYPDIMELLMQHGADINSQSLLGMRPIHFASRQNAKSTLLLLLKLGVCPDQQDDAEYTPLYYVCLHGHVDIVKILLDHGANVDHVDMYGRKPIDMLKLRECDAKIRNMLQQQDVTETEVP